MPYETSNQGNIKLTTCADEDVVHTEILQLNTDNIPGYITVSYLPLGVFCIGRREPHARFSDDQYSYQYLLSWNM